MKGKLGIAILGLFFCSVAVPFSATAASLYIDPGHSEINRGDAITLAVRLDVDEAAQECVNAIDAVITYTENVVPIDISIGDSIFNVWVENPIINKDKRTITFAGGIPNGYCGRISGDPRLTNNLINIIFRSPGFAIGGENDAVAHIDFDPATSAYLNDGQGTVVAPTVYGATIALTKKAGAVLEDPWREAVQADVRPPEEFSIALEKDTLAFGGKHYIVFNTTDKQTGVDQYQVIEQPLAEFGTFIWGRADAPWITARSPYVLKDQSLNSIIRVRALDKAGNEYIATLVPDSSMRGIATVQILNGVLALLVVMLLVVGGIVVTHVIRRRKRLATPEEEEMNKEIETPTSLYD
ncbi:MAG: hypothetical protein AAB388_00715 [Patescibacteria group bacterium]